MASFPDRFCELNSTPPISHTIDSFCSGAFPRNNCWISNPDTWPELEPIGRLVELAAGVQLIWR